ncbi:MAG: hypothetical protein ACRC2H_01065 [Silanimonas sp.]
MRNALTKIRDAFARARDAARPHLPAALAFARRHIEMIGIVPAILLLMLGAWYWSSSRGAPTLEIGGILSDYLVGLLPVALLGYLAYRLKAEYWFDLDEKREEDLHDKAAEGSWLAFWLIVKDRAEWLVLFGVLLFTFLSFSGRAAAQALPVERCAADMLVRWEVTSAAAYTRRYQSPIWPGGASGITWGVGYDGGHQFAGVIRREWAAHPAAPRLSTTAGLTGAEARAALPTYRDIVVPYSLAYQVLLEASIPRYRAAARRAYGPAFDTAHPAVQCALIVEVYNRGEAMAGNRRIERRHIRGVCLPARDWPCVADQLEMSCRVWANDRVNGPGLCNRRISEATVIRRWTTDGFWGGL